MAVGSLGDNIGLKEEFITNVCGLAFQANMSPENLYHFHEIEIFSEIYHVFSFSGSWNPHEWLVNNKPFGETKIDHALFPSLRSLAIFRGRAGTELGEDCEEKKFVRVLAPRSKRAASS